MAIDPKCTYTLYGVLSAKHKNPSNTFALIISVFVFLFLLFQVEHLIIITCGHLNISCDYHHLLSVTMLHTWIAPTQLISQLMTKVSGSFHQLSKTKLGLSRVQ